MSLRVWYPLVKDIDNQGLSEVTTKITSPVIATGGKLGKCYAFGTANNVCTSQFETPVSSSIGSLACWIKFSTLPSSGGWMCILQLGNLGGFATCRLGMYMEYTDKINISVDGSSTGANTYTHSIVTNTWYHLCTTYDGTIVKLYINGIEVMSKTATKGTYTTNASNLYLAGTTSFYCNAWINDARYYDHALSAKEVHLLSQGLICHYPLNNNGNGGDNIISDTSPNEVQYTYPSSSYSDKFSKTSTVVPSASQYILSFWAKSTNSGDKVRAHWYSPNTTTGAETSQGVTSTAVDGTIDFTLSDQWEKYWCIWTQSATTSAKKLIFPRMFSQASGQATGTGTVSVKCVKLEEGNQPTAWCPNSADPLYNSLAYNSTLIYDCSGYNNHSSASTHLPTLSESPRYSVSSSFASNAYSSFAGLATSGYADSYTFAWWGRFGNCNGHMMWGFADGNRLNLYCYSNNSYWNTGNGTSNPFNVPMSPYLDSKFHHFAVTGDGTTAKLYIDGEFKANATTYQGITGTTLILNGWNTTSSYKFNGALSDFRLYATALSADDILELYHTSASIDKDGNLYAYELKEV